MFGGLESQQKEASCLVLGVVMSCIRGRYVWGVISWGRHDRKSFGVPIFAQQLSPSDRHFRWIQRPFSSKLLGTM